MTMDTDDTKKEDLLDDEDDDKDFSGDDDSEDDADLDDDIDALLGDDDSDDDKRDDGADDDADDDGDEKEFAEKDLEDPEKRKEVLELIKKSKSALKQRAIWKKRAMQSGYGKEKENQKPTKKEAPPTKKSSSAVQEAMDLNELTNFRLDHPDLPRTMVKEIKNYARANQMSMDKAMERPLIRRFVNDKKLKERLSQASPTSRHRNSQSSAPKDWSTATAIEVAAHEAEVRRRASSKK